jgi:hypothetical protein
MQTKRTAKTTAAPTAKPITTQEAAAAATPPPRPLTNLQALIADEVADMLTRGGHEDEINDLLWAALGHKCRKQWSVFFDDVEKVDGLVRKFTPQEVAGSKAELEAEWRRNSRAPTEETTEPATASQRIRARLVNQMRERFESFVMDGNPMEHWVLSEILLTHQCANRGSFEGDELPLAMAMTEQMEGITREFIRIPDGIRSEVERYVTLLQTAQKAAA